MLELGRTIRLLMVCSVWWVSTHKKPDVSGGMVFDQSLLIIVFPFVD
jgi:hypothetical protein